MFDSDCKVVMCTRKDVSVTKLTWFSSTSAHPSSIPKKVYQKENMEPMDPWHGRIELSPAHMAQVQVLSGLHHFKSEIVVILKKVALCAHN